MAEFVVVSQFMIALKRQMTVNVKDEDVQVDGVIQLLCKIVIAISVFSNSKR